MEKCSTAGLSTHKLEKTQAGQKVFGLKAQCAVVNSFRTGIPLPAVGFFFLSKLNLYRVPARESKGAALRALAHCFLHSGTNQVAGFGGVQVNRSAE